MVNPSKNIFCSVCEQLVKSKAFSAHLKSIAHKNNTRVEAEECIEKINSAFRSRIASYRVYDSRRTKHPAPVPAARPGRAQAQVCAPESHPVMPAPFLRVIAGKVQRLLNAALATHQSVKINFELFANFYLPKNDTSEVKSFATENRCIHSNYDFKTIFNEMCDVILKKVDEFQERDSGWSLLDTLYLEVNINKYIPLRASGFIDLPKSIKSKKACINVNNNDSFCFLWCIMAALFPAKCNANRTKSYPHFCTVLNTHGMTFPVSFTDIKLFEKNNKISVNVYGLKKCNVVGPLYKSSARQAVHVNLLLLENKNTLHYCLIKDLNKLLRSQLTKHHGKVYFCDECLICFDSEERLTLHSCGGVATVLPTEGAILEFKHYERLQKMPFVIYADFETLLEPCSTIPDSNHTQITHKHIPSAFSYYITCSYDNNFNKLMFYRGKDCVDMFISFLQNDITEIYKVLSRPIALVMTDTDQLNFDTSHQCCICEKPLVEDRVRDHCHLTGKYRGAAHSYCNLRYKLPKFIPVFFHNLSGYDSHLFIRHLGSIPGKIKVIARNKENYISFTKIFQMTDSENIAVRFVDSFSFLPSSLDKLSNTLADKQFKHLNQICKNKSEFNLLRRKGVYPYDYMTTWSAYDETKLPPQELFFNKLNNSSLSIDDYKHAKNIWCTFNINNLGEYTDLYVKTDVLLLADVFENFRTTCIKNYKLDPAFYLTSPSYSFDAMLLKTRVNLELIHDLEIIRMLQSGIRGGVCLCTTRHAKANNKYQHSYDPKLPSNFLVYLDCNNLYGYAMCQSLPHSGFKMLSKFEIDGLNILDIADDAAYGYILEVDLEYPDYLHDSHNDLPFCAQKFAPPGSVSKKLIPNLYDKFHYVIHYIHLKNCIKHGLVLKKIHKVIKFKQGAYLKDYMDLNTNLRQKAKSSFEQDLFKLLNNSIFGKTLEDTERRIDIKLVTKWSDNCNKTKKNYTADRLISRPNFKNCTIFTENFVAVQMKPERVILDKPIYIGFSVLEISKSHLYTFHYSILKPFYGERLRLCYTDTDSLLYSIKTDDFYSDVKYNFLEYFDTSNYSIDNTYNVPQLNKKVPGLFKDELGGKILSEFVGLRSKLYCIKTEDAEIKKAKGAKKCVVKDLCLNDYNNVLLGKIQLRKKQILFKSLKHQIFTQEVKKIVLSHDDDKKFILKDKISTLSWGHYSII